MRMRNVGSSAAQVLALSLCLAMSIATGGEDPDIGVPSPGTVTLALFDKPPVIDGKVTDDEWRLATQTVGFLGGGDAPWQKKRYENPNLARHFLNGRTGTTRVGYTRKRLYIAISTELPPDGKLIANQVNHDAVKTVGDSGLEIWIADQQDDRVMYQMIANSIGSIFDAKKQPGAPDVGWRGKWEFENSIDEEAKVWHAEISLPLADFGVEGDPVGQTIKLMIARNFKRPWNQASWFPQGAFKNPEGFTRFRLTKDEPVVRITRLGEYNGVDGGPLFDERHLDVKLQIVNPGAARRVAVEAWAHSESMPSVEDKQTLELPAGKTVPYAFEVSPNQFHENVVNWFTLRIATPEDDALLFHYGMSWNNRPPAAKAQTWKVDTTPKPHLAARIGYYPSYHLLRVRLDPARLLEMDKGSTQATVTLTAGDGTPLLEKTVTWKEGETPLERTFETEDLPEGQYTVTVKFDQCDEVLTNTFERKWFPWEGNGLGITDEVIPPFTPITVEDDTVGVALRRYRLTGLGLWSSVEARGQDADEGYKELLAEAMELVVNENETLTGKGAVVASAANHVVYAGKAEHPAVTAEVQSRIEEDGVMRVELTLAPGTEKAELQRLRLKIPLRDDMCPLHHLSTTRLRINPAGFAPEGEGKVWDSNDFPNGAWNKNFVPYLWFGAEARGLCWFADNDKGWVVHNNPKHPEETLPPQELFREDGVLTLQLNLVQKPITLEEPRTLVFGLMATPGKPMREDWRAFGRPEHPYVKYSSGFAGKHGMQGKYPIKGDWSSYNAGQMSGMGFKKTREYAKHIKRYFLKRNLEGWPEYARNILTARCAGEYTGTADRYQTIYFEEFHSTSIYHDEAPTFYTEWTGNYVRRSFPDMPPDNPQYRNGFFKGDAIGTGGIVPSYRDFACWYAADFLRRGCGIYFDNSFPMTFYDPITSDAYRMENGRMQPSAGMWARRDYLKRIWTLHRKFYMPGSKQIMMIHTTNTLIAPYMVWNDFTVDLEWKKGPRPLQARFSHDLLRAETGALQIGCLPGAFTKCTGKLQDQISSVLALSVHEVHPGLGTSYYADPMADFGRGLPDCRIVNYWDDNPPLSVNDDACKWLLMERNGKLLVLLATWNPEPAEVTLTFAADALPQGTTKARAFTIDRLHKGTARKGQTLKPIEQEVLEVPVKENALRVPVGGYGYRFVQLGQ